MTCTYFVGLCAPSPKYLLAANPAELLDVPSSEAVVPVAIWALGDSQPLANAALPGGCKEGVRGAWVGQRGREILGGAHAPRGACLEFSGDTLNLGPRSFTLSSHLLPYCLLGGR